MGIFSDARCNIQANRSGHDIDDEPSLREAQAGAYWAVCSHFAVKNDPALVVMPTGSGKTVVMVMLAFGIANERVLIVAPNRFIVDQIRNEFSTLEKSLEVGIVSKEHGPPRVHVVKHVLDSAESWTSLKEYDVVVTTPNCASPAYDRVFSEPPADVFDTIFFDEAHHLPATTWISLRNSFPDAKTVGFTATPYRTDRAPVPIEIAFNYPLARAIEKGIYRPIEFIPVYASGDQEHRDVRLAERAAEVWGEENLILETKLLVRVARIEETNAIRDIYKHLGLDLEIVSCGRPPKQNWGAIQRAQKDKGCHGLIAVGMLGEGFDLPSLGIGVLHRPHQSLPATMQLVGRICRESGSQGRSAKVLAIPEEMQQFTAELYQIDASWSDLFTNLADAAVEQEQLRRQFIGERWKTQPSAGQVSPHVLKPSFSVTVFRILDLGIDIRDMHLPKKCKWKAVPIESVDKDWNAWLCVAETRPVWTTANSMYDIRNDLVVHYRKDDLLFESTTSEVVSRAIRESVGPGKLAPVSEEEIENVISQSEVLAYYNVGLRKTAFSGAYVPSYKTMMGKHAEATIRESDGQFFTVGHLYGKVEWGIGHRTVGISCGRGRVWTPARGHLRDFRIWCDEIAERLTADATTPLPHLAHLKKRYRIEALPAKPCVADVSESTFNHIASGMTLFIQDVDGGMEEHPVDDIPDLLVCEESQDNDSPDECSLIMTFGDQRIPVRYSPNTEMAFQHAAPDAGTACTVQVMEQGRLREYEIGDYLSCFPPTVFLADGGAVVGQDYYPYEPWIYNVPPGMFSTVDWSGLGCEITVEDVAMVEPERRDEIRASNRCSVLEATSKVLDRIVGKDVAAFCDHRSGEIADFVGVGSDATGTRAHIHLVHCKASKNETPGARQGDAYEVLGQARKCIRWIKRPQLFDVIKQRATDENLVKGSMDDLDQLLTVCSPGTARYSVYVVQPGFDIQKIREWKDDSIRLLLLSLYDKLTHIEDVDLHVIGS